MSGALQAVFQNQRSFGPAFMDVSTTGSPTITTDGNYKVVKFTGSGSFTVNSVGTDPTYGAAVDYLVVAGGASGGRQKAAGGGAGGLIYTTGASVTATTYTIVVGAGGSLAPDNDRGNNGVNSSGFSVSAIGGGGGGSNNGNAGGAGGGGARSAHRLLPTGNPLRSLHHVDGQGRADRRRSDGTAEHDVGGAGHFRGEGHRP